MPEPLPDFIDPGFPSLAGYLAPRIEAPPRPTDISATGEGNWFTAGLGAGFHGAMSEINRAVQAGAQFLGATDTAKTFADYAERAHALEQSYARPDLEEHPWSLPGIGYQIARMVPMGVAALGGGLLGAATAPEAAVGAGAAAVAAAARAAATRGLIGASTVMYPTSVGANVQRQITETGELTTPGKALVLGVPEAIVQGWLPGRLEKYFGEGILKGLGHAAATQGFAGGATEWMTQKMGDPNRTTADRAAAIGHAALSGAALGTIMHGAFGGMRALVGKPAAEVLNDPKAAADAVDQTLEPPSSAPPPAPPPAPPAPQYRTPPGGAPSMPGQAELPLQYTLPFGRAPPSVEQPLQQALPLLPREVVPQQGELPLTPGPQQGVLPLPLVPPTGRPPVPSGPPLQQELPLRGTVPQQGELPLTPTAVEPVAPVGRPVSPPGRSLQQELPFPPREIAPPQQSEFDLQAMPPAELQQRLNNVQSHLAANPEDATAQLAFRFLEQESQRRAAPVPEVPREPLAVPAPGEPPVVGPTPGEPPPAVTAPAVPVLNFTARLTEKSFKEGMAKVEAGPPEAQAELQRQLADLLLAREAKKQKLSGALAQWGGPKGLDVLDEKGKVKEEFRPEKVPEAAPEAPSVVPTAAVPEVPSVVALPAGPPERGPLAREVAPQHMPWYDKGYTGEPRGGNEAEQAAWDRGANDRMQADRAAAVKPELQEGIPEFLRRTPLETATGRKTAPPAIPPAHEVPIKTQEDRVAALNGVREQIAKLTNPVAAERHTTEAEAIEGLLSHAPRNPGAAKNATDRLTRLQNAVVEDATRPADEISPNLEPSPRAEAKQAPVGNLDELANKAQNELPGLRTLLGKRADAAIDAHEQWLIGVKHALGPEEQARILAVDPELDIEGENLRGLTQTSPKMREKIEVYLTTQHEAVRKALEGESGQRARVINSRDGLPVTQGDTDVASMAQRGVRAVDVADHIGEHTPDAEQAAIVAKLRAVLPEDTKLVFRDGVTDKEGEYFPKQKTIALYNAANSVATFIHEMVHAVTHKVLEGSGAAARAIHGIYDQLKGTGDHVGITDAHEMVAEAYANPVYRDFLKSKIVKGTSLWDRFVDGVRRAIGLDPRQFNALDRILSHGDDLMKEQRTYPNSEWMGPDSYASVGNKGAGTAAAIAGQTEKTLLRRFSESMGDGTFNARGKARQLVLGYMRGEWLAEDPVFRKLSPENLSGLVNTLKNEDPRKAQIAGAAAAATRQSNALSPETRAAVNELMALSTDYGYHPDWSLADYKDIHNDPVEVQKFNAVKDAWNRARQIPGAQEAFITWRHTMSALGHMSAKLNLQATERLIPGLNAEDAFRKFDPRDDLTNQPKLVNEHWQKELNDSIKTDAAFRDKLSADKAAIDAQLASIQFKKDYPKDLVKQSIDLGTRIDRLNDALKDATDQQTRMRNEPYFHLGREGDFFGTGKLVTKSGAIDPETGKPTTQVDKDVLSKFRDYLERNGFADVVISQGNEHDTFYTRVKTAAEMRELARVLEGAQKEGLLSKTEPIKRGEIFDPHIFERVSSTATQKLLDQLRQNPPVAPAGASPDFAAGLAASHATEIQNAQRALLSMTPDTSMSRLMAHRQNVPGYAKDMIRSQEFAAEASAANIARQSLQHEVNAFEGGLLKDAEKVNADPTISDNTRLGFSDTVAELLRQQRSRETFVPRSPIDAMRQVTNLLHLGMSPAYTLMQLGSLAITGVPELAKTHGYGPAMAAMTRAMPETYRALSAIAKSPDWLTAAPTREALEKAKLPPELVNTIMGAVRRGSMGTYTSAVTERSPWTEGKVGTALKAANLMGLYSDLAPRMVVLLAADKLYKETPHRSMTREQFIDNAVNQSQGFWGSALGARQMGKTGLLGAYTPVAAQFGQWNIHMTSKLYHEVYNAFAGEDAQTRKEALKYLTGHAAAVTMLSGTLGLPLVSVAASVYDWVANHISGRDDNDITASYRNFLAHTFGKDIGEIIARGAPRAAGMDFANWGEQDIVPGSSVLKILTEKRKWDDVQKDFFKSMGGPAADQVAQFVKAAGDLLNGDVLEAGIKMTPGLISGPLKAYKLGEQGFVDQHGQKLPISSPTAHDYMLTALGLKPAKQAEYQEVAREAAGLRAMREASSANISQHLRQAYMQHDQGMFNTWMAEAQKWQAQHPGLVPPHASFGRALDTHMRQLAQARGMGLPIGIQPQDIATRRQLSYGNFPVQ